MLKRPQVPEREENREAARRSLSAAPWMPVAGSLPTKQNVSQALCEATPAHATFLPKSGMTQEKQVIPGEEVNLHLKVREKGCSFMDPPDPIQQCLAKWVQTSRAHAKGRQPTWTAVGGIWAW